MHISSFRLKDVRCFRGEHEVALTREDGTLAGWTVFVGRNSSGKSTLLKALVHALVGAEGSIALESRSMVTLPEPEPVFASSHTRLVYDSVHDATPQSGNHRPYEVGASWHKRGQRGESVLYRSAVPEAPEAPNPPWKLPPTGGCFLAAYGPFRHLGARTSEQTRFESDPVLRRVSNLFVESASLTDAVEWLQRVHLRAFEDKPGAAELRRDALALLNDGLLPEGTHVERVDSDGLWVRRGELTLPLTDWSDGYRTVAALVLDLVRHLADCYGALELRQGEGRLVCERPGVVLIDEVDAHLHVSWQQRIGFWLRERFPCIQFLVTSHSPFVCQAASPQGIIRLPAPGEERRIEHVSAEVFRAVVHGSADDAVMSELFGLEHAHSSETEQLRRRLATLQGKLLRREPLSESERSEKATIEARLPGTSGHAAEQAVRAFAEGRRAKD